MLKQTEDRKELSTSTEIEGEGEEDKMVRKATGQPVRQEKKDVSPCRLKWLNFFQPNCCIPHHLELILSPCPSVAEAVETGPGGKEERVGQE